MTGTEILILIVVAIFLIEVSPAILGILLLLVGSFILILFAVADVLQNVLHKLIFWMFGIK